MESPPVSVPLERPSLSVVIPAFNEERHVGLLLSDVFGRTR
jgi:glycosyltransferase involved in cell wall biosynthesis